MHLCQCLLNMSYIQLKLPTTKGLTNRLLISTKIKDDQTKISYLNDQENANFGPPMTRSS